MPPSWQKGNSKLQITRNGIFEKAEDSLLTIKGRPDYHKEKPLMVRSEINGTPILAVGGGVEYEEDLKDQIRKMAEDASKFALQYARDSKERAEEMQKTYINHLEHKVKMHKENPRTFPDPGHSLNRKKLY